MRFLFISLVLRDSTYIECPTGIMSLSTALKKDCHEVRVVTPRGRKLDQVMREFQPQVVAFSLATGAHTSALELNRALRERYEVRTVVGGPHVSFFPEVIEQDGIDAACRGEGELALRELATAWESGKDGLATANFIFRLEDGTVKTNPLRSLVSDLDTLPFPDRTLNADHRRSVRAAVFLASRGCPYNCTYCFNHAYREMYGVKGAHGAIRYRSPENILAELDLVRGYYRDLQFVLFQDDVFGVDRRWMEEFARAYGGVGLPFHCHVHLGYVTSEFARLLKTAGCHSVSVGIESGNERLRREVLNRHVSNDVTLERCRMLAEAGIVIHTQNILGLPGSDWDKDMETLELNGRIRPGYAWASIFNPYPRTALAERAVEMSIFDGDYSALSDTYFRGTPLRLPHGAVVDRLHKLFALGVRFPGLRRHLTGLVRLPLGAIYTLLYRFYKGYSIKQRIVPVRMPLNEQVRLALKLLFARGV